VKGMTWRRVLEQIDPHGIGTFYAQSRSPCRNGRVAKVIADGVH